MVLGRVANFLQVRRINTKPAKRCMPKVVQTLPKSAGDVIVLDNGCTFVDLRAKASNFFLEQSLPPKLQNLGGEYLSNSDIEEMRALRLEHPEKWTVTQLAKKFKVSRSLVIGKALLAEERSILQKEIDDRIAGMSTKQQKGWILRHKIRQDRTASW